MSQRGSRELRKQLNKRPPQPWIGRLGNAAGTVEVPGRPGLWYVRPKGSDLPVVVQGGAAPRVAGTEVLVGADPYRAGRVRVLGINPVEGGAVTERQSVEAHAASHGASGSDRVYIASDQVVNGLAYASTGMTAHVNSGWVLIDGVAVKFAAGDIDLTSSIPATGARWSLIRVSDAGALSVQDGTPVDSLADLGAADVPALAAGYALIAVVRLYDGQTSLSKAVAAPDVIDVRFVPRSYGLPAADVSVDASGFSGNLSATDTDVQTALETIDAMTSGATDADAIHDNVAGEIAAIAAKATPADADLALIEDSADSNNKKKVTLVSILSAIGAALYAPIAKGVTNGDSHDHSGGDGAQIDHTGMSNIGTNTHAQIDSHITSHASRHKWLGADPLSVGDLMMNSYPAMFKDWRNLDGFTQSNSGTGALTTGLMYLTATTGATNGSRACCYGAGATAMIQTTSLLANFRTRLNPSTALTNSTIWMGIFTNPTAPTNTEHHAGFKIVNGTVYATCGNGSAQTVEATGDTLGASAVMEFYLKEKTNQIEYYVNGVLRKTFTTNRPNSGTMYVTFCLTNQAAETKTTLVGPYWIMSGAI